MFNKSFLCIGFVFATFVVSAQQWFELLQMPNANLYTIQQSFENYWQTHDKNEKGKGYKAFRRFEHFAEPRVFPSGNLSALQLTEKHFEDWKAEQLQLKPLGNVALTASATWTAVGPMGPINGSAGAQLLKSGRLNFITVHPTNFSRLWVGAPAGGLWSSSNAGQTWTTTTDFLPVTGCSDLAVDPTNTLVMYLATGDGDAGDNRSIGVLKTTNGGQNWVTTGLTNPVSNWFLIRRLIINPSNPQILLAATNTGVYRTANGGANWTLVNAANTCDLEFKPGDPNTVYAAGNSFSVSTNGGQNFMQITTGIPTTGVNRMAIAVSTNDANYVYVLASSSSNSGYQGFYTSVNSGMSFTASTNTLNLLGWSNAGTDSGGQGWYDLCIASSPNNKNEVVVGGVNVWRSTDAGATWSIYGHWVGSGAPFTHADQHDLEYAPDGTLYVVNDGTVYRRTANGWTEICGSMNISQIYRMGMSSLTANKWISGHQDNGTSIWNGSSYNAALGGDGMDCFIDRTNDQNVFGEYQNGGMNRSTNGGINWSGATTGLTGNAPWLTVWKQDPMVSTRLYCGRQDMFVSNNLAASWSTLAPMPTTTQVREFAISLSNNQVIYVVKSDGIYKTTNAGSSWTTITGSVPINLGWPEYICVSPTDANKAWVVLSSYSAGNKVFYTANGGTSWTNISFNLPNIPANCIVYEPGSNDRVYVGMDVGVYYKDNSSNAWTLYNTNLPNVPISELEISPANQGLLFAATYGRGVWVASLFAPLQAPVCNFSPSITSICAGKPYVLTDQSSNTPTAWSWTVTPVANTSLSALTASNPVFTAQNPGTYTISLIASNAAGPGTVVSKVFTVLPQPTLSIGSQYTLCAPGQTTLSTGGATSYTWLPGSVIQSSIVVSPTITQIYTVTGVGVNGCAQSKTVSLSVVPAPNISISGVPSICAGTSTSLTANGAQTYTWNTGSGGPALLITPSVTTTFTVTGTGANGCVKEATYALWVWPQPTLSVFNSDTMICTEESILLTAQGALQYTWEPGTHIVNPLFIQPVGSTQYTCTGTDANGCKSQITQWVWVDVCESFNRPLYLGKTQLLVFPSPVKSILQLHFKNCTPGSQVALRLLTVEGKCIEQHQWIYDATVFKRSLNLETLVKGIYILEFKQSGNAPTLFRILKD